MIAIRGLGVVALAGCLLAPTTLAAQDSKSAAVAGQLTQLLDQMKPVSYTHLTLPTKA